MVAPKPIPVKAEFVFQVLLLFVLLANVTQLVFVTQQVVSVHNQKNKMVLVVLIQMLVPELISVKTELVLEVILLFVLLLLFNVKRQCVLPVLEFAPINRYKTIHPVMMQIIALVLMSVLMVFAQEPKTLVVSLLADVEFA